MKEILYGKTARMLVEQCTGVEPHEHVLVITDSLTTQFGLAIATACQSLGCETVFAEMTPRKSHGYEPPRVIAAAMATADVIFSPTTYAIAHTEANRIAMANGARHMVLRGMTEELWLSPAMNADYDQIIRRTDAIVALKTAASTVRITTASGTDLTLSVAGRTSTRMVGRLTRKGWLDAMPNGKTTIAPVEGTAEGILVYEGSMDGVGKLDGPIRCEVRNGRIVSVSGGISAAQLRVIIEEAGENGNNIAEFGMGTNHAARLTGNIAEDKRILGSAHIAIGDNHVIGGTTHSNIHLDGMILKPTVSLDGKVLIQDGKHVSEY